MPIVTLRSTIGSSSPNDITVEIKDNTFEYLKNSDVPTVRVSAYLDQDWSTIDERYAELFVEEGLPFQFLVKKLTPGSRERTGIQLPGAMKKGEQLIVEVIRKEGVNP